MKPGKLKDKVKSMKRYLIWNGFVREEQITLIPFLNVLSVKIYLIITPGQETRVSIFQIVIMAIKVLWLLLYSSVWLYRNRDRLDDKENHDKFSLLYVRQPYRRNKVSLVYTPLFLAKRILLFAVNTVILTMPNLKLSVFAQFIWLPFVFFLNINRPFYE